jgi:hypothetical protein
MIGRVLTRIRQLFPGAEVVFATSTPVIEEQANWAYRSNAEIAQYNAIAREVLIPRGVRINELGAFAAEKCHALHRDWVHYNEEGSSLLADEIIEYASLGGTLCDVTGDLFVPTEDQVTTSEEAIKKQMELIDKLHKMGKEVLMSSHVCKFTPAERVLEIALEHQRRGADIAKIVTGASTMEEQIENLRITALLKEKLGIPFLFLAGGECKLSRRLGGTLGNCMSLTVHEYDELATPMQPLLSDMKIIRELIKA